MSWRKVCARIVCAGTPNPCLGRMPRAFVNIMVLSQPLFAVLWFCHRHPRTRRNDHSVRSKRTQQCVYIEVSNIQHSASRTRDSTIPTGIAQRAGLRTRCRYTEDPSSSGCIYRTVPLWFVFLSLSLSHTHTHTRSQPTRTINT